MLQRSLAGVLVAAALASMPAGSAHAAGWLEKNFWLFGPRYSGILPPCDHQPALVKIQHLFGLKQRRFWNSDLRINTIGLIREIDFRPWAPDTIPRRFCAGVAVTSDGIERPLYYSLAEDTGIIGASWGVEWCVEGVDQDWAFNSACRMARP
jgi:hypothetical protein